MSLGKWGEEVAEKYLKKKGYTIINKNFRCRMGEIDIIALDRDQLVFIEVKTRKNQNYGLPCEAVNPEKIRHLTKTAAFFIATYPMDHMEERLDVIEILTQGGMTYLHHIENVTG